MDMNMKFTERNFKIDYRKAKSNSRSVPVVLSSEKPVDRGDYIEVLIHREDTIDLSRAPLPLIESHNRGTVNIGLVENLHVNGGKLRGTARLGTSARANELWDDIEAGIVRSVSVGYEINDYDIDDSTSPPTMNVKRLTPFELSIVSTPADTSAGFYRNLNSGKKMKNEKQTRSQRIADKSADSKERERVTEILAIADKYTQLKDEARAAIQSGTPLDDFRRLALKSMGNQKPIHFGHPDDTRSYSTTAIGSRSTYNEFSGRGLDSIHALLASAAGLNNVDMGQYKERSQELSRITGRKPAHGGILIPLGDLQDRALTAGGTGGSSIQTDVIAGNFIDVLRSKSTVMNLGATMINGLVGDAAIPRKTAGTTAYWVDLDDTDSITESTIALDQVSLSLKSVAGFSKFSHKMLAQSSLSIEQMIREDLAATLANALDIGAIQGTGLTGQPTGVTNTAGINAATYAGAPSYSDIVNMEGLILADNVDTSGSMAYLTTPEISTGLKTTEKATGTAQFVWDARDSGEGIMNGYKSFATANVPSGSVLLGKWSDLIIGTWNTLEIVIDPYSDFQKATVGVRAIMDVDVAVRHPQSFCQIVMA